MFRNFAFFGLLLPLAAVFETMRVQVTPGFVLSLGYLVVANSLVSISLLLAMLRAGSASKVSAWFFLIPPVTATIAVWWRSSFHTPSSP